MSIHRIRAARIRPARIRPRPGRARLLVAALAVAATALLAGCTSGGTGVSAEYTGGDYVSSDGWAVTVSPEKREEPVSFGGDLVDGGALDSADLAGKVVVVNFWYAQCPPCRTEAPDLEELAQSYDADQVAFVGVNTRDSADLARTFEDEFGISYPSILDVATNDTTLAFSTGKLPVNATPTTFVLDAEGRIAARFSGTIAIGPSVVGAVIDDVLAES